VAATLRANMYTREDLEELTGESQAYLADLTCRVAFWKLWARKPWSDEYERVRDEAKRSHDEALELIRTGQRIFEVAKVQKAGHASAETMSAIHIDRMNMFVDKARGRFYPMRRIVKGG